MGNLTYTTQQVQEKLDLIPNSLKNFKHACLLGDSITAQHGTSAGVLPIIGSQGFWNWANWLSGSPFIFTCNLGVSGDVVDSIMARGWQVPKTIDTVFILACTNDVNSFSSASNQAQIDAEVSRITTTLTNGLTALKAAGKNVCIATVPPLNAIAATNDARIALMDSINAFIMTTKTLGLATEVVDLFTALWDTTQPTLRKFKTNSCNTDGVHLSNLGGQLGGFAAVTQLKSMYSQSKSFSNFLEDYTNNISILSQFRNVNGNASMITYGSGTLGGGWRSLNYALGTPTLVLSNTEDYTDDHTFVGPMSVSKSSGEKWQKITISNAVDGSQIRIQLKDNLPLYGGELIAGSLEVKLVSQTNLKYISLSVYATTTNGTSPVDQPYTGTANSRTIVNQNTNAQTDYVINATPFRKVLMTKQMRVPENINQSVAVNGQFYIDISFGGVGDAVIYVARPQFLVKMH